MANTVGVFFHDVFLLLFVITSHAAGPQVGDIKLPHIGPDTVTVTWTAPKQPNSDIKSYHVTVTNMDATEKQELETTSNGITLRNLTPSTQYHISIRTANKHFNGNGDGLGEPVLIGLSTEPLDGQKVRDISFPDIGSYSINVQWRAPEMPYGEITSYRVETTEAAGNMKTETDVYETKATIINLSPYTTYKISVRTINKPDYNSQYYGGAGEDVTHVVTTLPLAGQKVTDIKIRHIGSVTATLTWTAPKQPHGDIKSFHVTVTNRDTKEQEAYETMSNIETLRNLTPHTLYDITVRTENYQLNSKGGGLGEPVLEEILTKPLAGQKVRYISFPHIGRYSISVQWRAPEMPYGEIISYRVETTDEKEYKKSDIEVYKTQATIFNLSPYTTYKISVRTINKPDSNGQYYDGVGEAVTNILTTMPLAGQKVTDIKIWHIGTDTATLTWMAPKQPHGDIKSYHITVTNRDTKEQEAYETTSNVEKLRNLTPHTMYDITVRTENYRLNSNGGGLGDPVLLELSTEPLAGQKVRDMSFPDIGSYSINVQWRAPEMPYGEITSYNVKTTSTNGYNKAEIDVSETEATIYSLIPYTTYNISVRTVNKPKYNGYYYGGAGEAVTNVVTTLPLAGQQVIDLKLQHIGMDTATVTWRAPEQPHGDIKSYHVTVMNRDTEDWQVFETTSNEITLYNLTPNARYDISVKTENRQLNSNGGGLGEPVLIELSTVPLGGPTRNT